MDMICYLMAAVFSDIGNIAIGILFLVIGVTGFALLKINEKNKDNK